MKEEFEREQLTRILNFLLTKWFVPFWDEYDKDSFTWQFTRNNCYDYNLSFNWNLKEVSYAYHTVTYRELTSIEWWLWKFLCENDMIKENNNYLEYYFNDENDSHIKYEPKNYLFWCAISALRPEKELEQLILDNIKLEFYHLN